MMSHTHTLTKTNNGMRCHPPHVMLCWPRPTYTTNSFNAIDPLNGIGPNRWYFNVTIITIYIFNFVILYIKSKDIIYYLKFRYKALFINLYDTVINILSK